MAVETKWQFWLTNEVGLDFGMDFMHTEFQPNWFKHTIFNFSLKFFKQPSFCFKMTDGDLIMNWVKTLENAY